MSVTGTSAATKAHVHDFKPAKTVVLPHKRSRRNFRDELKQWKCKCGDVSTYGLERQVR